MRDSWQSYRAHLGDGSVALPAPPANRYLLPEELELFSGYSKQRFVTPAWKGLVLGTATDNLPMETKASLVAVRRVLYSRFLSADCAQKTALSKDASVNLVLSEPFECEGFEFIGSTSEGLALYKFVSS